MLPSTDAVCRVACNALCGFFLQIDPMKRPSFQDVVVNWDEIKSRSQMAVVLADLSSLNIDKTANVMNKTILEKILGNIMIAK
jgi:hypothetical protein